MYNNTDSFDIPNIFMAETPSIINHYDNEEDPLHLHDPEAEFVWDHDYDNPQSPSLSEVSEASTVLLEELSVPYHLESLEMIKKLYYLMSHLLM